MVLDAKYKRLGSYDKVSKLDRNDVHQVITYMTALKADRGGDVYKRQLLDLSRFGASPLILINLS